LAWVCAARAAWCRTRNGRNTNGAASAAIRFIAAATRKTDCQLPVACASTLPSGTNSDAVPFAV